jgi:hypothetical protein
LKRSVLILAAVCASFLLAGCSKEACLKKHNFDSVTEFCKRYKDNRDKDDAIHLQNVMQQCGCKCE